MKKPSKLSKHDSLLLQCWLHRTVPNLDVLESCDTPAQGLIGLIGYSYQQVATSFPEAGLQRTPRLSVLGPEQFGDG